jgi:hypothetical protein
MSLKTENSRRVAKWRPVCMGLKALIRWKYHEIIWINHIAYGRYSWGIRPSGGEAIFLGYSSPGGGIPRNIALFWEGDESPGGGQKSCDNGIGK